MIIKIPKLSFVVLVCTSGSGRARFARSNLLPTNSLVRFLPGLVSDDENNQAFTPMRFEVLNFIARQRLARGSAQRSSTAQCQTDARGPLVGVGPQYHVLPVRSS